MKSIYSFALLASLSIGANAQTAYDALNFAEKDLSGTSRYVGMGGALSALGADLSVMHSNPAGIALYKRSDFNVGMGLMTTGNSALNQNSSKVGLDHIGVVFSKELGTNGSRINFGIDIKNNRSYFCNLSTPVQGLYYNGKPLFSQTFQIADYANRSDASNNWRGFLPDLGADNPDKHPGILGYDGAYFGYAATSAEYLRATRGSNTLCDLDISFNINDVLFLGATVGFSWINMTRESEYSETSVIGSSHLFENYYETSGCGADLKFGIILRPSEDSPFRIGLSYKTPTYYRLTDRNSTTLYYNINDYNRRAEAPSYSAYSADYDYDYYDPWTVNLSAGYTIGRKFAIGAEYEYQNFANAEYSTLDNNDVNYFRNVNRAIKEIGRGQNTWKIGVEYKPTNELSLRFGYNYVTSPYHKDGYYEVGYDAPHSETDWINWGDKQRFCAGIGFKFNKCYLDFAYQYQKQKGDFYAFNDEVRIEEDINHFESLPPTEISNNRGNATLTFGIRF